MNIDISKLRDRYNDPHFPKFSLSINRQPIEVTSCMDRPDPTWKYTDKQGHYHYYHKNPDDQWDLYPTLIWITDAPATDEYPEVGHYECAACGEEITPERVPPSEYRTFVPGSTSARLEYMGSTRGISSEEADMVMFLALSDYDYQFTKLKDYLDKLVS